MNRVNYCNDLCHDDSTINIVPCIIIIIIIIIILLTLIKTKVGKIRKIQRSLKWKKLVRVVLRGKTVVQQYGVKTLNGNRLLLLLLLLYLTLFFLLFGAHCIVCHSVVT